MRFSTAAHTVCSYEATEGKRLADMYGDLPPALCFFNNLNMYGHLPGFWMHRSLVVDFFEKNITKWSGEQPQASISLRITFSFLNSCATGQPTDQLVKVRGVKATKNLKSGAGHSANIHACCCLFQIRQFLWQLKDDL